MKGVNNMESGGLFRRMCMCAVADMLQKWKDMCNVDIIPNGGIYAIMQTYRSCMQYSFLIWS